MKQFLALVLSICTFFGWPANVVHAQDTKGFTKPVRILIPRNPGGGSDNLMRMIAPGMEKSLGVSVVLENRADLNGVIATSLTAQARPDGHVVLASENSFYTNPGLLARLPYDTEKQFSGITMLATAPVVLIANPKLPVNNLRELVEYAKKHDINYASGGTGGSTHLAGVQFNDAAGLKVVHVPFSGSGAALTALLGGQVELQFGGLSSARQHIESGRVKAIAVTGDKRHPSVPDVPTFKEAGLPEVDTMSLWSMHAPANTPLDVRMRLRDAALAAMRDPEISARMVAAGYDALGNTPEEHQKQTEVLIEQWKKLGKTIKIGE